MTLRAAGFHCGTSSVYVRDVEAGIDTLVDGGGTIWAGVGVGTIVYRTEHTFDPKLCGELRACAERFRQDKRKKEK